MTDEKYQQLVDDYMRLVASLLEFNKIPYVPTYSPKTAKSFTLMILDPHATEDNVVATEVITSRDLDGDGTKAMFKLARLISWLDLSDM